MNKILLDNFNNEELWLAYADIQQELKNRGLARTSNMVGERGEFLVIETYNSIKGLPNLQARYYDMIDLSQTMTSLGRPRRFESF